MPPPYPIAAATVEPCQGTYIHMPVTGSVWQIMTKEATPPANKSIYSESTTLVPDNDTGFLLRLAQDDREKRG